MFSSSSSDRIAAIRTARELIAQGPLYLDTETTGLDIRAEIVEISILDADGSVLLDTLVRPSARIPRDATAIHHIDDMMVRTAPTWPEVWSQANILMQERLIGIYNLEFDLRMLRQTHLRYRMPWSYLTGGFDIMDIYARFYGQWNPYKNSYRWQSLENAGRQCRIPLLNSHRAIDDARLARAVLHAIAESGT
jgi:DNA polymerase-3 subunit epsilon